MTGNIMYVITSLYPTVRVGNSGMAFNLTFLNTVSDEEKSSKVQMQNSTCKNSSRIFSSFSMLKPSFLFLLTDRRHVIIL